MPLNTLFSFSLHVERAPISIFFPLSSHAQDSADYLKIAPLKKKDRLINSHSHETLTYFSFLELDGILKKISTILLSN
ncbi:hypothetical protein CDL12_26748 [Handroanthus impetiginosus]|uniref:Uncharacterized protein n=1 Tax=Handroanthus impetiginosus TaxID=429701 RepID=A0A2G9G613_9LAMI|nr:hypothetical protein CDL12_26748 [Handroanthus impetiginosus]